MFQKIGLGVIIIGVSFYFIFLDGPASTFEQLDLLLNGTTTSAEIIDVNEDMEDNERGGMIFYYKYTYEFTTLNGELIRSSDEDSGPSQKRINDIPSIGKVVYLRNNPKVNKLVNKMPKSLWEFTWRKIGIGLFMFSFFGFLGISLIKDGINEQRLKPTTPANRRSKNLRVF